MLDKSFNLPKYEEKQYPQIPTDIYQGALEDVSAELNKFETDGSMQLKFTFRIIEEGDFYGRLVWYYTSLIMKGGTKPTKLYKIITALTGKTYEKEQYMKADEWLTSDLMNSLIDTQVRLSIMAYDKEDGMKANKIDNILIAKEEKSAFDQNKMESPF